MKETTDIYFGAALLSLGAKLENVDRDDPRHMVFEFSHTTIKFESPVLNTAVVNAGFSVPDQSVVNSLDNWEKEWANGTLMVCATKYADSLRKLKSVVHSR